MSFSSDLVGFVEKHIHSIEQLEVLILLRSDTGREWTAEQVSRELRTNPNSAAQRLSDLKGRGFARSRTDGGEEAFSYDAATGSEKCIAELAEAYRKKRIALIQMIFDRPKQQLKHFADAFHVRKKEEN